MSVVRSLPLSDRRNNLPSEELTLPEKFLIDWLVVGAIFAISILHFSWFYNFVLVSPDEGIALQGAQRILEGQVPYRDFFSFVTPGSYYWTALFFAIFGNSFLVARAVLVAEGAILSVLTYLLARRACSRWSSFLASVSVTLLGLPNQFFVLHNWDSTLWACLTLYSVVWFLQRPHPILLFTTGLLAALTCLFEQSKGAGLVFGLVLGVLILAVIDRKQLAHWNPRFLWVLIIGFAAPFLLTFIYFGLTHSLPQMLSQWLWPLSNYSGVNKTPYGFVISSPEARASNAAEPWPSRLLTMLLASPLFVIPLLPLIAVWALCYWIVKSQAENSGQSERAYDVLVSATVIGLVLSLFATRRPDFVHLVFVSPILFVPLAWMMDGRMLSSSTVVRKILPATTFILLFSFLGFGLAVLSRPLNARETLYTRRGTLKTAYPDEIIQYIQTKVPSGQRILVYPYLPLYYYLTGTFSPSRYEYLREGLHTPEQFEELIRELETDHTRLVFIEPSFHDKLAASFPADPFSRKDPVADYIGAHYKTCANLTSQNFWNVVAMVRKDLPCP
jgi:4-amino-4-deoxy-L-arabinose transferase-like glycosyltransferase